MKHAAEAELAGVRGYKEKTQGDLNAAKINSEGAKAADLHSSATKKNLDAVEQEYGVKQERDKELLNVKSQNNIIEKTVDSVSQGAAQIE